MLRQLPKISNKLTDKFNNKIKSTNYYFLGFLLLVCYNYYALYNYLLDKNYNLILFYFVYLFLLYSFFNLFSYIILFITIGVFQLLTIDKYIKNSSIIENHESGSVRNYRQQNSIAYRQRRQSQRRRQRQRQGQVQGQIGAWNNYQGYIDAEENEYGDLGDRIQKSAESRARRERANAEAVTEPNPDLAYDYILAHLPNCSNEAIALKALPPMPVAT
jgi:hypothetical protein